MKIFMSSDTYLPDIGGAEIHVFELQKRLRRNGHDIALFVTNPRFAKEDEEYHVTRETWSLFRAIHLFRRMWHHSRGVDIYHAHYSHKMAMLTGIVARLRRKPFLITQHGLGLLDQAGTPWKYQIAYATYRWVSHKLATHVISTSEDLAEVCKKYIVPEKITVIPNGLDTTQFHLPSVTPSADPCLKGAHPIILTVRRLVQKNGIHYMISAIPYILKRYPNAKLIMIGDGRMRAELETLTKKLGIEHACIFLGTQPNTDVPAIAARADVVIFPSTAESTSIACAEMMSLERPIIASRVGGLIELIGAQNERGWLVKLVPWESCNYDAPNGLPEDRYQELAETIMYALEHPNEARQKSTRAREYAFHNLDWNVVTRRTVEIFERLRK